MSRFPVALHHGTETYIGAGKNNRKRCPSINTNGVECTRPIASQPGYRVTGNMLARYCFGEVRIECAECQKLMVGRPAIAYYLWCISDNRKSIGSIWINCPELPIAQKRYLVAPQMSRAACSYAAQEKQPQ